MKRPEEEAIYYGTKGNIFYLLGLTGLYLHVI